MFTSNYQCVGQVVTTFVVYITLTDIFIVVPCILITLKFLSPTNAFVGDKNLSTQNKFNRIVGIPFL